MEERWDLEPLTERDKAAPSWGDVLTLAQPRTDDPLSGVAIPSSGVINHNQRQPSELGRIHARRVSRAPMTMARLATRLRTCRRVTPSTTTFVGAPLRGNSVRASAKHATASFSQYAVVHS
jgi:hypothetical protein